MAEIKIEFRTIQSPTVHAAIYVAGDESLAVRAEEELRYPAPDWRAYPQPNGYHPDYSISVSMVNGKRCVNAYWIKHGGENLYTV